jgi:hypothetical protein
MSKSFTSLLSMCAFSQKPDEKAQDRCILYCLNKLVWCNDGNSFVIGILLCFVALGVEFRASHMLDRCSTASPVISVLVCFSDRILHFCSGSVFTLILLPLPPSYWGVYYQFWPGILHLNLYI